jgi:hypothetical protein
MAQRTTSSGDDHLLDELGRVLAAIDPIPEAVQIAARAAIDRRAVSPSPAQPRVLRGTVTVRAVVFFRPAASA